MYLLEFLKKYEGRKIKLFVDMDGVIVDYDFGNAGNYDEKRPLYDSIKKLEEVSKLSNVELCICSITRMNSGFDEKNIWLDKYAPFFKERIIISREDNNFMESSLLKANVLKNIERDDSVLILIDDDPVVLKKVHELNPDIVLLKDTCLVD